MNKPEGKQTRILFIAFLALILVGIFWKTFNFELVWDDKIYLKQNILFNEKYPIWSCFQYGYLRDQLGIGDVDFFYRPLLTLSFWLESRLWGIVPSALRAVNLVIYLAGLGSLYLLLKRQTEKGYFAEVATLIYALVPLNAENVLWAVGRGDLLLLLWGSLAFLTLDSFIRYKGTKWLVASSLFFLLGILSKESFIYFLPILILYESVKRKRINFFYHGANLSLAAMFFVVKTPILGIKSLGLEYSSSLAINIKAGLGTLGYYMKTMLVPFDNPLFVSLGYVMRPVYLILGISLVIGVVYAFNRVLKHKSLLLPLSLFLIFLGGHLLIVYTPVYPFKIYARYMMIPALGLIIILVSIMNKLGERRRLAVTAALLLVFIPAIVINSQDYKTEMLYWQRAHRLDPQDRDINMQLGACLLERGDYLSSELIFNGLLKQTLQIQTAIFISLHYADIEIHRADYESLGRWLSSIESMETMQKILLKPFVRYFIDIRKARSYFAQADSEEGERLILRTIDKFPRIKESYGVLFNYYTGREMWGKARTLESSMKKQFRHYYEAIDTEKEEREFAKMDSERLIDFYESRSNYAKAIETLEKRRHLDIKSEFRLAKLHYRKGETLLGDNIIHGLAEKRAVDAELQKMIGDFYLREFSRAGEALVYYDKSITLDPKQNELVALCDALRHGYLGKLTPLWKTDTSSSQQ